MVTTTESDSEEYRHPINHDIVKSVAGNCGIHSETLHKVLEACDAIWDPYRDRLDHIFWVFERGYNLFVAVQEPDTADVYIVQGHGLRPGDVLQRADLREILLVEQSDVTTVEMGIAVTVAHEKQAKQLGAEDPEYPVVIRQ